MPSMIAILNKEIFWKIDSLQASFHEKRHLRNAFQIINGNFLSIKAV